MSEVKPFVDTIQAKRLCVDATKNRDATFNGKRKINEISITNDDDISPGSSGETTNCIIKKMPKKRAKKLEWRKRQRLKKEARLKSQMK